MTIVLTYTKEDGTQEQAEYEDDVIQIDLMINDEMNISLGVRSLKSISPSALKGR